MRIRLYDRRLMRRRPPPERRPSPDPCSLLLAATCALVAGCGPAEERGTTGIETDSVVVTDADGARLALPGPARRIVSLVPSATATLDAFGARDVLVGRTDFDTQEWARGIPSVGGGLEPSLEAIVALRPDLVVRFAGEQDPRTRGRLDELGIPYLTVRPERLEDVFRTARLLGQVTGRTGAADSLANAIRADLERTAAGVAAWPRLDVAYVLGGSPPWVSGPDTYIAEVLQLLGGDNVFSDLGARWAAISPEELRTREIDVVLVANRGEYDESLTPGARIVAIGGALEIPGPGVVSAARTVAELLHGRPLR